MKRALPSTIKAGLAALVVLTASFVFLLSAGLFSPRDAEEAGLETYVEGLAPGVPLQYSLLAADGTAIASGQAQADEGGRVHVAVPRAAYAAGESLRYSLSVGGGAESAHFLFGLDPVSGTLEASGQGLGAFGPVTAVSGGKKVESRADWSGLFRDLRIEGLNDGAERSSVELAFHNVNVLRDAQGETPLLVRIFSTSGGGRANNSQVNQYTTGNCGDPQLSHCTTGFAAVNNDVVQNYVYALMLMTEQLSAVMMQQMGVIGKFLDAKMQMETQRELQVLQAEAHKDYHPSDQMCRFGSFVRTIARAEVKSDHDAQALSRILMATYTGQKNAASGEGYAEEMESRLVQFRQVYCDPQDNNNGLRYLCQHDFANPRVLATEDVGGADPQRFNKDIDFARTVDAPLTLGVDFRDTSVTQPDEEDVIALAKNLYWPRSFNPVEPAENLVHNFEPYLDARQYIAMANVAHNSFTNIVGLKSSSPHPAAMATTSGPAYMKSMMREFGLSDTDINNVLGENPSYYAQMEVLSKKIYQHPNFYTNLYDKPANVDRIGVSMDAIGLMQDRDLYESALRREMLLSMLVEDALAKNRRFVGDQIADALKAAD